MVLVETHLRTPTVNHVWADQGYRGERLSQVAQGLGIEVEVVKRSEKGFQVLPRRWVVERTFAWLGKQRLLSKDYERLPEISEADVHMAMISLCSNSSLLKILFTDTLYCDRIG